MFPLRNPRSLVRALTLPLLLAAAAMATPPAAAQTLTVAVDSSLADAVLEVARAFEAARPGVSIKLETGASGALLDAIARGGNDAGKGPGHADLLVSADTETLQRGTDRRLLGPGVARVLTGNAVVLVAPASRPARLVTRLADLARPEVARIAIARIAEVPAGRQARQAIDVERLWPAVQRKIVFTDTVAQTLEMVARGEVDAGLVYRTDAIGVAGVRLVAVLEIPSPVRHAAALVAGTRQPTLAREFLEALVAPAATQVYARRGFVVP